MVDQTPIGVADHFVPLSSSVQSILDHLCQGDCRAYGDILEWCEARGDCWHAVVCPTCGRQFVIDEDELTELQGWTAAYGGAVACGIHWDD